jgi:hypothetical protein
MHYLLLAWQYLKSLRAYNGKKPAAKTKGKKPALLTFHEDEDEDGIDHDAVQEAERVAHEKLERHLSRCMKCGDSKFCKVDRSGNHVHLTFQQLNSWAAGLASTCPLISLI